MTTSRWRTDRPPRMPGGYPSDVRDGIGDAVGRGDAGWRVSGSSHLEVLHFASGTRLCFTLGRSAGKQSYAGKWRSFERRMRRSES